MPAGCLLLEILQHVWYGEHPRADSEFAGGNLFSFSLGTNWNVQEWTGNVARERDIGMYLLNVSPLQQGSCLRIIWSDKERSINAYDLCSLSESGHLSYPDLISPIGSSFQNDFFIHLLFKRTSRKNCSFQHTVLIDAEFRKHLLQGKKGLAIK